MMNSIIRPPIIHPIIPKAINLELSLQILGFFAILGIAWLCAILLEQYTAKRFGKKESIANIVLPIVVSAVLVLIFGYTIEAVRGFILFLLLLFASNSDLQTREVDDYIPLMIGITALIGVSFLDLPMMFLSAALITLPQLLIATLKPNTYGGADIKLMAACAFLLGLGKGLFAIIIGLTLAVFCTLIMRKVKKQNVKESFALVPYLAVGCFIAYLL